MSTTINFTEQKFKKLKLQYEKAVTENKEQFYFDGNLLLTSYAKYLVEYLTTKFK